MYRQSNDINNGFHVGDMVYNARLDIRGIIRKFDWTTGRTASVEAEKYKGCIYMFSVYEIEKAKDLKMMPKEITKREFV